MKGFLVKDFCMLAGQKKLFILYIFLMAFMSYTMESSFIISYFPMIATLLAFSTITYDSFDNGMAFIMTMPGARKNYANSKYLLSLIMVALSWVAALVMQFASMTIKKEPFDTLDLLGQDMLYLPMFLIICSIIIPVVLKFGAEKGRIIMIIIFGIAALIVFAGIKLKQSNDLNIGFDMKAFISSIESISPFIIAAGLAAVALIIMFISMIISNSVMKNKEY